MKILYLVETYPDFAETSPNIFVHNQVKEIQKKGIEVAILKIDLRSVKNNKKLGFWKYVYEDVQVFCVSMPLGPIPYVLEKMYEQLALWGIKNIIDIWGKPNLIHAHFYMMAICSNLIKDKYNIPYVITEHSSMIISEKLKEKEKRKVALAYYNASYIWAVGKELRKKMLLLSNVEINILPNIVPEKFTVMENIKKNNVFTFLSVGNLCKIKRMDLLIKAMTQLIENDINAQLYIVGEGEERKTLENLIRTKKMEKYIFLLGKVDNNDLPLLYARSHCFVLVSEHETFGIVWREALACGLPVIGTTCGGPEEIIEKENGCLIPINDQKELVKAMKWMYSNYNKFDSKMISQKVKKICGKENIVMELIKIYKKIN